MDKHQIAKVLDEMGILLQFQGENPYRIRAYHTAAQSLDNLDEDLAQIIAEGRLEEVPGIGPKISKIIYMLFATGSFPYYERLKDEIPRELWELLRVPGLGPTKIKRLHEELGICSSEELVEACQQGKLAGLKGFGQKAELKILEGLQQLKSFTRRLLWWNAMRLAQRVEKGLKNLKESIEVEISGSLRRKLETVGNLDFVVSSKDPASIIEWFSKQSMVETVLDLEKDRCRVRFRLGIQASVYVVEPEQFAFALRHYTGSSAHNEELEGWARSKGFSLTVTGIEPTPILKPIKEQQIYEILALTFIPPELREGRGEIEAAAKGQIPTLITEQDIRGVFHCHTVYSDGRNTLEQMALGAQELGFEYLGIADHSKASFQAGGMPEEKLFEQIEAIRNINESKAFKTYLFAGIECDILKDGDLDYAGDVLKLLDYVIVSAHRSYKLSEEEMTNRLIKAIENPYTTMVGHVSGRLLLHRDPRVMNMDKVIDACIANNKIMELNAQPSRLDMDWRYWHKAIEKGLKCSINPDAHSIYELQYFRAGVNMARKGWLEKKHVINTLGLDDMKQYLLKR